VIKMKSVYVLQINTPTDRNLLPLAAGLLVSYSKNIPLLYKNYKFIIKVLRESPKKTANSFFNPDVVAFSCYSWNLHQNIEIAKITKQKWPDCLIVFGGPSSPCLENEISKFVNPFIDIYVHGEGEITFSEILISNLKHKGFKNIQGITYLQERKSTKFITNAPRPFNENLDCLPSPFLDGTFDEILRKYKKHITGALWETNRGCPFSYAFCYWGQSQTSKIRTFGLERLSFQGVGTWLI